MSRAKEARAQSVVGQAEIRSRFLRPHKAVSSPEDAVAEVRASASQYEQQ